jgi:hypothetical protein
MSTRKPGIIGLAAAAALVLTGCGVTQGTADQPPAIVQAVQGSQIPQVRLTDQAMHRIGIATQAVRVATVTVAGRRGPYKVIPYSAVIYDNDGSTWTYVETAARTFMRERITVRVIRGGTAVVSRGPAAGAMVVTVGAPELLGTEYNISGEE